MQNTITSKGILALMVSNCAGMVDIVALPVWINTLIEYFHLSAQRAGSVVTLFLIGSVISSVLLAPRINHLKCRQIASIGFALAALFLMFTAFWHSYILMMVWHLLAGLCVGAALSVTHGTIARSHAPHRLFALVGIPLGIFAVFFLAITPQVIARTSGQSLFLIFAGLMVFATIMAAIAFPKLSTPEYVPLQDQKKSSTKLPDYIWMGIFGICCMAVVQSMTFSFLERIGHFRGFSFTAISGVLVTLGLVNLLPSPLAAILEKRWSAYIVILAGPIIQAILSFTITNTHTFLAFAASSSVFAAIMIFTHTFAFGLLSRLDPTGRSMAATPAILMTGAAVGPILAGTLVDLYSYSSIGLVALLFGGLALFFFSRIPRKKSVTVNKVRLT